MSRFCKVGPPNKDLKKGGPKSPAFVSLFSDLPTLNS